MPSRGIRCKALGLRDAGAKAMDRAGKSSPFWISTASKSATRSTMNGMSDHSRQVEDERGGAIIHEEDAVFSHFDLRCDEREALFSEWIAE
jgi:hypothetical protein